MPTWHIGGAAGQPRCDSDANYAPHSQNPYARSSSHPQSLFCLPAQVSQLLLQSFYEERGSPAEAAHENGVGGAGSEQQPLRPKEELLDSLASGEDDDAGAGSSRRRHERWSEPLLVV